MAVRDAPIDPLAQLAKDLDLLVREPAKGTWDPSSIDSMVTYAEQELRIKLRAVPRVLAIFTLVVRAFQEKKRLRLAVLGPRGGGKTAITAALELIAYRWFGYSWQNVGGSLEQAKLCYSYVALAHHNSADLAKFTVHSQAQDTRSRRGDSIAVSAASQTSVRGPHPIGSSGAGGLTLDEAAMIPDDICDAAKGQLTTANPSALIQLSTMGESQTGRFWELLQDPDGIGYRVESFDIFDVAKRCPYDCATTCPVKEHFANDFYVGIGSARQLSHKAYCGGRAHGVDGWVDIDEVAQHWRELGPSTFERELMGKAVASTGHIFDPILLQQADLGWKALSKDPERHRERFKKLDKYASVDWGFAGATAIVYAIRLRDALLVYRSEYFTRERFQLIREHLVERCISERIETLFADSASPSDNEELAEMFSRAAHEKRLSWNTRVLPVVFSKFKMYGIGEVRRRLEQKLLGFASSFGDQVNEEHARTMKHMRAYHVDKTTNKPAKVDDHVVDAVIALCVGLSTSFRAQTRLAP